MMPEPGLAVPWPLPDMKKSHLGFSIKSGIITPIIGSWSKILLCWCNNLHTENIQVLHRLVSSRPKGTPLLTVCNHYSCIDDPILGGMLKWRDLWAASKVRWTPTAHDIAFTRRMHSWFFSACKCVPIVRGQGVYQRAMNFLIERLEEGQWVHIFPEGKVNLNKEYMRLKWGVGRLIYDSTVNPIVLLFYHIGMEKVLPNTKPYIPRFNNKVTVVFGEPMDFADLVQDMKKRKEDPMKARKIITDRIQEEMSKLRDKAEKLHLKNS